MTATIIAAMLILPADCTGAGRVGVGGTVGAGAGDSNRERLIIEQRERPVVRERTCVTNAAGTTVCEDVRR